MKSTILSKLAALSGVLGALLALIVVLVGGYIQPEYNHITDFISELNAEGSKSAAFIGYLGFVPIGILGLVFLWRLKTEISQSKRVYVGLIFIAFSGVDCLITALAPCDMGCPLSGDISLSQKIHNISGILTMLLVPIGVYLLITPFKDADYGKPVTIMSAAVITMSVFFVIAMGSPFFTDLAGLMQRTNLAIFYIYISLLSLKTYSRGSKHNPYHIENGI